VLKSDFRLIDCRACPTFCTVGPSGALLAAANEVLYLTRNRIMQREGSPAAEALHQAFTGVFPQAYALTDEQRLELREKVCALVDARKEEGVAPEHIVIEVRQIAQRAGGGGYADPLIVDAVKWCIAQYFGED